MIKMRWIIALALIAMGMTLALGAPRAQAQTMLQPKVDGFVFFADYSGSMAMKYEDEGARKIAMAKQAMTAINQRVPDLGYEAALATFAPYGVKWQGAYGKAQMGEAAAALNEDFEIFGRLTPMGKGLSELAPVLEGMNGKTAVIIFSDGVSNKGVDPVAEATALYQASRGNLCFHVVSFADSADGEAVLDSIAALSGCSVQASGPALLADDAAMDQFVRDVFYDEVAMPMKPKKKMMMVEEVEEVIELRINFDFDSSEIRPDMVPVLDEAAAMLKDADRPSVLEGHTCNIGTEEYNQGLSERRAASVKQYLVKQGVPAVRLGTTGMGETAPKYDNTTEEGRKLNRRVEITIK